MNIKKIRLMIIIILVILLSSCSSDEANENFYIDGSEPILVSESMGCTVFEKEQLYILESASEYFTLKQFSKNMEIENKYIIDVTGSDYYLFDVIKNRAFIVKLSENQEYEFIRYDLDTGQVVTQEPVNELKQYISNHMITSIMCLDDGLVSIMTDGNKQWILTEEFNIQSTIENSFLSQIRFEKNENIYFNVEDNQLYAFQINAKTGQLTRKIDLTELQSFDLANSEETNKYYSINAYGIKTYELNGDSFKFSEEFKFKNRLKCKSVKYFFQVDKGYRVIFQSDEDLIYYLDYTKTEKESYLPENTLTIEVYYVQPWLSALIEAFMNKYPDYNIELIENQDYLRYSKQISTSIMGGKGPNLFQGTSTLVKELVKNNKLASINDFVESPIISEIQENIKDDLMINGKIYELPFNYRMPVYLIKDPETYELKNGLNILNDKDLENVLRLAKQINGSPFMSFDDYSYMVENFVSLHEGSIVDLRKKSVNYEGVRLIIEQINRINEEELVSYLNKNSSTKELVSTSMWNESDLQDYYYDFGDSAGFVQFVTDIDNVEYRMIFSLSINNNYSNQKRDLINKFITFAYSAEGFNAVKNDFSGIPARSLNRFELRENFVKETHKEGYCLFVDNQVVLVPPLELDDFNVVDEMLKSLSTNPYTEEFPERLLVEIIAEHTQRPINHELILEQFSERIQIYFDEQDVPLEEK